MSKQPVAVFINTTLSIMKNVIEYRLWRCFNWQATYADFYAWQVTRKLDKGEAHKTLGKRLIGAESNRDHDNATDRFSNDKKQRSIEGGVYLLEELKSLGMKPEHKVVEYGCGSLRIGRHFIDYLQPGNFQGLDITDRFYLDGLDMLDPDLVSKKQPQCYVINKTSLETVAKTKPDFIYCVAVTQHVPPSELDNFMGSICNLMGQNTKLLLYFVEANKQSRAKGKSWVYAGEKMHELAQAHQPDKTFKIQRTGIERTSVRMDAWTSVLICK